MGNTHFISNTLELIDAITSADCCDCDKDGQHGEHGEHSHCGIANYVYRDDDKIPRPLLESMIPAPIQIMPSVSYDSDYAMERVIATIEPWHSNASNSSSSSDSFPHLPATPHSVISALSPVHNTIHQFTPDTMGSDDSNDSNGSSMDDSSTDDFDNSPTPTGSNSSDLSTIHLETPRKPSQEEPVYPSNGTHSTEHARSKTCSIATANYSKVGLEQKNGKSRVTVPTFTDSATHIDTKFFFNFSNIGQPMHIKKHIRNQTYQ